uniref:Uncharacterized protein n=1 Tax=Panagrellus redivivus TaxID=6233 RepID=A0A7E4VZ65_PANRE
MLKFVAILFLFQGCLAVSLKNCPMPTVRPIIDRAHATAGIDAPLQMQVIRRIMEDIYGGSWGVIIIKDPALVSSSVHWTIPDHKHKDGSSAFCLYVKNSWQYNVFKTGDADTENRLSIEEVVDRLRNGKARPERLSVTEFDRRITEAIRKRRRLKSNTR